MNAQQLFSENLLEWYLKNKRDLPWRATKDPYRVWISEVILQQTRIDQGLPYYLRFINMFPDVISLAGADETVVLKLWQGLGYYSRARHLLETAKVIALRHQGVFPSDFASIRKLKGIGDYSAAAIASISFGLPYPVIDGNVIRFLCRLFGIKKPADNQKVKNEIRALANTLILHDNPGDFNQAMMEFGALICKPANPDCSHCPFTRQCLAFKDGLIDQIPARSPKAAVKNRFLNYFVVSFMVGGKRMLFLNKRTGNDIWKNLYDFPCVQTDSNIDPAKFITSQDMPSFIVNSADYEFRGASEIFTHLLTHQRLSIRFYQYSLAVVPDTIFLKVSPEELNNYPFPRVIAKYLSGRTFG